MTVVTAAALRRISAPTASASTATRAISAAVPTTRRSSVAHDTGKTYCPLLASCLPTMIAAAAATSPAMKLAEPITTALAASTRPRRGLAARVTRIRPRRYSVVMNSVATTISAISPANVPMSRFVRVMLGPPGALGPDGIGAMSPDPVTVTWLPAWW